MRTTVKERQALEEVNGEAFRLAGIKWWKPAFYRRISLKIAVYKYLDIRERTLEKKFLANTAMFRKTINKIT